MISFNSNGLIFMNIYFYDFFVFLIKEHSTNEKKIFL
jgi:hypothetical protein